MGCVWYQKKVIYSSGINNESVQTQPQHFNMTTVMVIKYLDSVTVNIIFILTISKVCWKIMLLMNCLQIYEI